MRCRLMIVFRRSVRRLDKLDKLKQTDRPTLKRLLQISQALVSLRSDLQSQIGRTFGALERRLEQVETGNTAGNPVRNQGVLRQGPSDVFGQQYSGDGDCSFNRIGSPKRRHDRDMVHLVILHVTGMSVMRGDVLSRSEKWLPSPPVPNTRTWRSATNSTVLHHEANSE